ncbi:SLP1 [Hepatospora eriocheir]|uniref:SLP1 n=2 Tax=Hepatospora eriocheir TaxID=1081669 RepID=A0A1X0QCB1_9MICR|nr:SLP1 [Hepatospora eriocheir]
MFKPIPNTGYNSGEYGNQRYDTNMGENSSARRPNASYAELITMAIESSPEQMLTLKEIYNWISSHFSFFNAKKMGWQNSIRHNLSLNRCFYKVPRAEGVRGKGSYWKINYEFQNVRMGYRIKKYNFIPNQRHQDQTNYEFSHLLNDNRIVGDNIGVSEIPYKRAVFDGNLNNKNTYCYTQQQHINDEQNIDEDDKSKLDRIFSFK